MEPTIYKPSIYNGAGVYKTGAEECGFPIRQDFKEKEILGKIYKCVEISDNVFFPIRNLDYIDENINFITNSSQIDNNENQCNYFNFSDDYEENGLFYNYQALTYLNSIRDAKLRDITSSDLNNLYAYIVDKISSFSGYILSYGDLVCTFCCKKPDIFKNALGLLDLGFDSSGYQDNSIFNNNKWCGFGSQNIGNFLRIKDDYSSLEYVNTNTGWSLGCRFPIRYIIDEN